MNDDPRSVVWERLASYALGGLLVGLLVVSMNHTQRAEARAEMLHGQLVFNERAILEANEQREWLLSRVDRLIAENARLEEFRPERTVDISAPCEERDTPVFPRDSQFVWTSP